MASVIGIDEVGRGCWAGPLLVVAARAKLALPEGLADSKTLTKIKRETLVDEITKACDLGEGWVEPCEIDDLGLAAAMRLGVSRALSRLGAAADDQIIMDGLVNYCPSEFINVETVARADATHPVVSAASIYAKVTRDRRMAELSQLYPNYQFEKHVGYGTAIHMAALKQFGICDLHRLSYKPIRALAARPITLPGMMQRSRPRNI